jgi:hypothetical protein
VESGQYNISGIPGAEPPEGKRPWLQWLELALAIGLMLFFALAVLGFVLDITGSKRNSSGLSRPGQVVTAAVCLGLVVLCGWWARRVEHRIRHRRGDSAAIAFTGTVAPAPEPAPEPTPAPPAVPAARSALKPPPAPARRTRRRGRHYGPASTIFVTALFTAATLGSIIGTFVLRADGERSSFVQHHGIPALAVVTNVNNIQDCGRSSCSYHSKISARLTPPVRGATQTVINYPDYSDLFAGEQVRILVDPKELGYSEFAGSPSVGSWHWIALAVLALVLLGLDVLCYRGLWQLLEHRRRHLQAGDGVLAVPASGS